VTYPGSTTRLLPKCLEPERCSIVFEPYDRSSYWSPGHPPSPSPHRRDPVQARRLLDAAAALPDGLRAPARGPTYHAIFALCYGLGLRAGEACSDPLDAPS
jgi:hypothetical protein